MEKNFDFRQFRTAEDFQRRLAQGGIPLPVESGMDSLRLPLAIGKRTAANRICIQPLEGYDSTADGAPSELVYRRYRRFAGSGAGTVWFESAAVSEDGKSNPHQMMLSPARIPEFRALLQEMDRICLESYGYTQYKILQLTHSGRVSRAADFSPRPIAAVRRPGDPDSLTVASDDWIDALIDKMTEHAVLARDAGFDAVDIKACHGYFLCELLEAFDRSGPYGGSFENRTRALVRSIEGIRKKLGDDLDLTVRLNAYGSRGWGTRFEDGRLVPDLDEPVRLCRILKDLGVRVINLSASQPPVRLFGDPVEDPALRPLIGPSDMLCAARVIRASVPGVVFVCSGLSAFRQFGPAIAAGGIRDGWFDLAGFGRQALAYPGFAQDALSGRLPDPERCCVGCSSCFRLMNPGMCAAGCVVRDPDPYAELYRRHVLTGQRS